MSDERWVILYAKNTTKKAKKWLDGKLTAQCQGARTRVQVYDDMGSLIEEAHVTPDVVCDGAEFALERFIIQLDAPLVDQGARVTAPTQPAAASMGRVGSVAARAPPHSLPAARPVNRGFHAPARKPLDTSWRDAPPQQQASQQQQAERQRAGGQGDGAWSAPYPGSDASGSTPTRNYMQPQSLPSYIQQPQTLHQALPQPQHRHGPELGESGARAGASNAAQAPSVSVAPGAASLSPAGSARRSACSVLSRLKGGGGSAARVGGAGSRGDGGEAFSTAAAPAAREAAWQATEPQLVPAVPRLLTSPADRPAGFLPPRRGPGGALAPGAASSSAPSPFSALAARGLPGRPPSSNARAGRGSGPLVFPSAAECAPPGSAPPHATGGRFEYDSLSAYTDTMGGLVHEQLNLQLWQLGQRLHGMLASGRSVPQLRSAGVALFPGSELFVYREGGGKGGKGRGGKRRGGKRRRGGSDDEVCDGGGYSEDDGGGGDAPSAPKLFLTLKGGPREPSSATAPDDLWVLLRASAHGGAFGIDEHSPPLFVRALWHGPTSEGKLAVALLGGPSLSSLPANSKYHALRGPNAGDPLSQIAVLEALSLRSPPCLPFLLCPRTAPATPPLQARAANPLELLLAAAAEFRLNKDQAEVLRRVVDWFGPEVQGSGTAGPAGGGAGGGGPSPPVVLVHGAFGAGKSHLLAAALWLIRRLLANGDGAGEDRGGGGFGGGVGTAQVLLASLTNVAVDNVLQVLLDHGEGGSLLRIGSARRIARSILPHSTHGRLAKAEEVPIRNELAFALSRAPPSERAAITAALAEIDGGGMAARARAARRYPILGATCCATRLPVMEFLRCDIVVLDECSQMSEPASLLPIARLGAKRLLCVGDPCQLPPTLLVRQQQAQQQQQHGQQQQQPINLSLTLFERLARCGVPPVPLSAQYRCHPRIAGLASALFYQGRLTNGLGEAAAAERAPLLEGLPTLGFSQIRGSESTSRDGSITNRAEAARCLELLRSLVRSGIPPAALGIICLYRAQATLLVSILGGGDAAAAEGGAAAAAAAGAPGCVRGGAGSSEAEALGAVTFSQEDGLLREVSVSTVDAFQGAEREVILVSTCRTDVLGFVASPRRLNVTLTRARRHLLIVGSAAALLTDQRWSAILDAAAPLPDGCARGEVLRPTEALLGLLRESEEGGAGQGGGVEGGERGGGAMRSQRFVDAMVACDDDDSASGSEEVPRSEGASGGSSSGDGGNWLNDSDSDAAAAPPHPIVAGGSAVYRAGNGSLTPVVVLKLHTDDPEGGVYVTIRLPDGRERHTELARLRPAVGWEAEARRVEEEGDGAQGWSEQEEEDPLPQPQRVGGASECLRASEREMAGEADAEAASPGHCCSPRGDTAGVAGGGGGGGYEEEGGAAHVLDLED